MAFGTVTGSGLRAVAVRSCVVCRVAIKRKPIIKPVTKLKREHVARKLRWSGLLFFSLVAFVLFANTKDAVELQQTGTDGSSTATSPSLHTKAELLQSPSSEAAPQVEPRARAVTVTAVQLAAMPLADSEAAPQMEPRAQAATATAVQLAAMPLADPEAAPVKPKIKTDVRRLKVKKNDTLSGILHRSGHWEAIPDMLALGKQLNPFNQLLPNRTVQMESTSGRLTALVYEKRPTLHHVLERNEAGFQASKREFVIEKKTAFASGEIRNSFYLDAQQAGLSDKVIISMANVLAWDIDFVNDIRAGDRFAVLYEEEYLDGKKLGDGRVLAVRFHNRNKLYEIAYYRQSNGKGEYFTSSGLNVRKAFLRNPVTFTRVSSRFNPKRIHPLFKVVRPHRGVDYAARAGTPVHASGDGKIIFRGVKKGYGNVVIMRHGGGYSTLFAHLQKFRRGQSKGSRVKQGEVIGYVGSTGYATGSHLHYEFRVNGVHKNPLTVYLPAARPLPKQELKSFTEATVPMFSRIKDLADSAIAGASR